MVSAVRVLGSGHGEEDRRSRMLGLRLRLIGAALIAGGRLKLRTENLMSYVTC